MCPLASPRQDTIAAALDLKEADGKIREPTQVRSMASQRWPRLPGRWGVWPALRCYEVLLSAKADPEARSKPLMRRFDREPAESREYSDVSSREDTAAPSCGPPFSRCMKLRLGVHPVPSHCPMDVASFQGATSTFGCWGSLVCDGFCRLERCRIGMVTRLLKF